VKCPHCQNNIALPFGRKHLLEVLIITLAENGGNRIATAEVLGVSIRCVRNWLRDFRRIGVIVPEFKTSSRRPRGNFWTPDHVRDALAMRANHWDAHAIGRALGRTPAAVKAKLREMGLPLPPQKSGRRRKHESKPIHQL